MYGDFILRLKVPVIIGIWYTSKSKVKKVISFYILATITRDI